MAENKKRRAPAKRGNRPAREARPISAETATTLAEVAKVLRLRPDELASHPAGRPIHQLVLSMAGGGSASDGPVRETFARLGDKWSPLLLFLLRGGPLRHAALHRLVNITSFEKAISQRMLTLRLRTLERDGFVLRSVKPTVPPQVTYALTPLGSDLASQALALTEWIDAHKAEIWRARQAFETQS